MIMCSGSTLIMTIYHKLANDIQCIPPALYLNPSLPRKQTDCICPGILNKQVGSKMCFRNLNQVFKLEKTSTQTFLTAWKTVQLICYRKHHISYKCSIYTTDEILLKHKFHSHEIRDGRRMRTKKKGNKSRMWMKSGIGG